MQRTSTWIVVACAIATATVGSASSGDQAPSPPALVAVWQTEAVLDVPESVLYDPAREVLYVASIGGKPTAKDGNGFISRLAVDGSITDLKWVTGLDAPKGMGIHGSRLFVTDIDRVIEIDVDQAAIVRDYPVDEAEFLNDIAVAADGTVYVSDYSAGNSAIYRISDGKTSRWLADDAISRPNGLDIGGDRLVVGCSGDGALKVVTIPTREISVVADIGSGIDGVESDGAGGWLISDWSGKTSWVSPNGAVHTVIDTTDDEVNAADIEYIAARRLLLVPTFFDNRVMAYTLE